MHICRLSEGDSVSDLCLQMSQWCVPQQTMYAGRSDIDLKTSVTEFHSERGTSDNNAANWSHVDELLLNVEAADMSYKVCVLIVALCYVEKCLVITVWLTAAQ